MSQERKEVLPPMQRILLGFQRCFLGSSPSSHRTGLSDEVEGLPAELTVQMDTKPAVKVIDGEVKGKPFVLEIKPPRTVEATIRGDQTLLAKVVSRPEGEGEERRDKKTVEVRPGEQTVLVEVASQSEEEPIRWEVRANGQGITVKRKAIPVLFREPPPTEASAFSRERLSEQIDIERLALGRDYWKVVIVGQPSPDALKRNQEGIKTTLASLAGLEDDVMISGSDNWKIGWTSGSATALLAKLGVIAFALGVEGAEKHFKIKGEIVRGRKKIPAREARELLSHFTGDEAIPLGNVLTQYATAKTILFSHLRKQKE